MGRRAGISLSLLSLLSAFIVFGGPRPALACTCSEGLPIEQIDAADLAFVGVVSAQQPSFGEESMESLVTVTDVVKGEVGASIIIDSPTGGECGEIPPGIEPIGVTATVAAGQVLASVCSVMAADQLLAAGEELGLEITTPPVEELTTELPESASNYAAAIPLSIILSLVFLAAVALGTRTTTVSSRSAR